MGFKTQVLNLQVLTQIEFENPQKSYFRPKNAIFCFTLTWPWLLDMFQSGEKLIMHNKCILEKTLSKYLQFGKNLHSANCCCFCAD